MPEMKWKYPEILGNEQKKQDPKLEKLILIAQQKLAKTDNFVNSNANKNKLALPKKSLRVAITPKIKWPLGSIKRL